MESGDQAGLRKWVTKKGLTTFCLILLSTPAYALCPGWTGGDTAGASALVTLHVLDWRQTRRFTAHGIPESNPYLGPHPSPARVNEFFLLAATSELILACALPTPWREFLLTIQAGRIAGAVQWNLNYGYRF